MALLQVFIFLLFLLHHANSVSFNFPSFSANTPNITYEGDAFSSQNVLQLTKNEAGAYLGYSVGRASYAHAVQIWDAKTGNLTDFTTHFSFIIKSFNDSYHGDGLAFYLVPLDSKIPPNSTGGYLGLLNEESPLNTSKTQFVAIEFDSFWNQMWDPSSDHVGININSIRSVTNVTWQSSISSGSTANAWITYNSTTKNLSVFLTYAENPIYSRNPSLFYVVDLRNVLPERVSIGFSAGTGALVEIHNVLSWEFNSSLEINNSTSEINSSTPEITTSTSKVGSPRRRNKVGMLIGLLLGIGGTICGLGLFFQVVWRKRVNEKQDDEALDVSMDHEFEKGTGPKRFSYPELSCATNNFSEDGKLGEGGFGSVHKGLLSDLNLEVAVKRVSKGSKQGKKEYVSEVKIISRLRHRNLVQLVGWCHEKGDFLLVYEFMPNGSLDSHLFKEEKFLTWNMRYKIALGLASALLYLHEEWEQCVVHRDIKSSNIMLDSCFNAKLGDFGLARLVDHELGSQTTVPAGTMGYLAPECVTTGKASKESDIYSFGVVCLEISCGRKPIDPNAEPGKVSIVEWVWDCYGKAKLLEATDNKLSGEFDARQVERLMVVGLWCCYPDYTLRPSIPQVINLLNFESLLPSLPRNLPVATYATPADMCKLLYTSSTGPFSLEIDHNQCSSSTCTTSSLRSESRALLHSRSDP